MASKLRLIADNFYPTYLFGLLRSEQQKKMPSFKVCIKCFWRKTVFKAKFCLTWSYLLSKANTTDQKNGSFHDRLSNKVTYEITLNIIEMKEI